MYSTVCICARVHAYVRSCVLCKCASACVYVFVCLCICVCRRVYENVYVHVKALTERRVNISRACTTHSPTQPRPLFPQHTHALAHCQVHVVGLTHGLVCELQLHLKSIVAVKTSEGHAAYVSIRDAGGL